MKPPIVTLFLLVIFIVNYSQNWHFSPGWCPTLPTFSETGACHFLLDRISLVFFFLPLFKVQKPTQQVEPMGYKNNLVSDYSMSSPGSPCWLGLSGWAVLTQKSKRMVLSDGELRSSRVNSESLLERWLDSPTTWNIWGACSEKISLNAQWAHR